MKIKSTLLAVLMTFLLGHLQSQTQSHPTISDVKVVYKAVFQSSTTIANIQAIPESTINLSTQTNISRIYFTIQDPDNNAILYNVNYLINSPTVTSNGATLFENNNGSIFISSGQPIGLKPYTIKVQTSDTLQNQSTIFSLIQ